MAPYCHMIPENDEEEHVPGTFCWCKPEIVSEDADGKHMRPIMVVHKAQDCREVVEEVIQDLVEPDKGWKVHFLTE